MPIGTEVVYTTTASVDINPRGNVDGAAFSFYPGPHATVAPSGFYASRGITTCGVQITIMSDTPECYPYWGVTASEVGNGAVGSFYSFNPLVFYDPKIIGHAKTYSKYLLSSDSVSFDNISVNNSLSSYFAVLLDSLGQYRTFRVLNLRPPFRIDSIFLQYPCNNNSGQTQVWFSPTKPGHYIDTVYIVDQLTNDSLPLILIGEGVAASVGNIAEEASRIAISPNPCDKHCTLSMNGGQIEHVIVRNILGECVLNIPSLQNEELTISTASFSDGIYFIEVRTNESVYQERVIVAH